MKKPILLYSTNTRLAYTIADRYYGGKHYVWCSPNSSVGHAGISAINPPTSDPLKIYRGLLESSQLNDEHCPKIEKNRVGLLRGAEEKFRSGAITKAELDQIRDVIAVAKTREFEPIFYVIPYDLVHARIVHPKPADRANALSQELQIYDLETAEFDALVLV